VGNAADEAVARFYTPSYDYRTVAAMNVHIEAIRETVDAFHVGNPRLLLVATALRRAFEEGTVGGGTPVVVGRAHESAEEIRAERTTVEMIDPEQASPRVQQIFDDIKTTLGLPLVNSDYQPRRVGFRRGRSLRSASHSDARGGPCRRECQPTSSTTWPPFCASSPDCCQA
jgi:hypothetical protein